MKVCTTCKQPLPLSAFGIHRKSKDGLRCDCRECVRTRVREYSRKHRVQNVIRATTWNREHPERRLVLTNLNRNKRRAVGGHVKAAEWLNLIKVYDGRCAYCFDKPSRLTQDHIVPLSRGGQHVITNIVPACGSCNSRKNNKTAHEFIFGEK